MLLFSLVPLGGYADPSTDIGQPKIGGFPLLGREGVGMARDEKLESKKMNGPVGLRWRALVGGMVNAPTPPTQRRRAGHPDLAGRAQGRCRTSCVPSTPTTTITT